LASVGNCITGVQDLLSWCFSYWCLQWTGYV